MLITTKGIVLHKIAFSENSIIVKIFTEKKGMQSFIIKNAHRKKSTTRNNLFGTLALVEVTYDVRPNAQIHYIKEITCYHHYSLIPFDINRSTILIFYNEILYKLLFDAAEETHLFTFLEQELINLDDEDGYVNDVHIRFLIKLASILGFQPTDNYDSKINHHFSLQEGCFCGTITDEPLFLSEESSRYLHQIISREDNVKFQKSVRNELLKGLTEYYMMHNNQIKKIESVEILIDILN